MPFPEQPSAKRDVGSYFSGRADVYAAHRPSYPPTAIETALAGLGAPARVADVGCGTGISSRMLAHVGAKVIGLDPNQEMLAQARRQSADHDASISYRRGTGEQTGLDESSVDLVLCAQSFHWFDAPAALAEFHRILVPAGRLALLWNIRQPIDAFMVGYEETVRRAREDAESQGRVVRRNRSHHPDDTGLFTNVRVFTFDNPQRLDLSALLGRAHSASYFPRSGPVCRELEEALRDLFAEHQSDGYITLRQRAELTLADPIPER